MLLVLLVLVLVLTLLLLLQLLLLLLLTQLMPPNDSFSNAIACPKIFSPLDSS